MQTFNKLNLLFTPQKTLERENNLVYKNMFIWFEMASKLKNSCLQITPTSNSDKKIDSKIDVICEFPKEPPEFFCKKRCSQKFLIIHGKTPVPVNFEKFLRTPFLQNTSGRLLLEFPVFGNLSNIYDQAFLLKLVNSKKL